MGLAKPPSVAGGVLSKPSACVEELRRRLGKGAPYRGRVSLRRVGLLWVQSGNPKPENA